MLAGSVVAAHGRQYLVELTDGERLLCFPRGKKSEIACGDRVCVTRTGVRQGVIDKVEERLTLLYRSNEFKQKLIAANVTQIIVVVATEPSFSDELVTRCIAAAESQDMKALIVLNKSDLKERLPVANAALLPYKRLGYRVLELSAQTDAEALRPHLQGETSVFVGQSGMGKSTLTNALVPNANAPTREISAALDSGKHTTTHATLYRLDADSVLIDSPGLQEFGLRHLSPETIEYAFPELRPLLGKCRFRNCRHEREPDCALRNALSAELIDARRFAVFRAMRAEAA